MIFNVFNRSESKKFTSQWTNAEKESIIAQALSTPEARTALAQSMASFIPRRLEYQAIGHKLMALQELPQGALPVYEKAALVAARRGSVPLRIQEGEEIIAPTISEYKLCLTCGSADTPDCCGFYTPSNRDELDDKSILDALLNSATKREEKELLDTACGIIANAGGGDWTKETPEWQESAAKWRDSYHIHLKVSKS